MAPDELTLFGDGAGELVAFRWTDYDVPFWARPNTRPGRWHHAGAAATQYWSLAPEAAWAELIRHESLQSEEDLRLIQMPIWVCRVSWMRLVDLRRPDQRTRCEISEDALIADDWGACQALAEKLRTEVTGVIAPSAALPDTPNLTLFGARRAITWGSRPALASAIPATVVADGRPPRGLVQSVRRLGVPPEDGRLF